MNNPFDKESWTEEEKEIINAGGWQCSFCGSINAVYITSCICGHNQDDSYENLHGRYVPRPDEEYTEQQPIGETAAETPVDTSASVNTEAESSFEEIPVAAVEAEAPFEEIPAAPAAVEAESPFEEIPAAPAAVEPESPFEEIPATPDSALAESEEPTAAEEPAPAEATPVAEVTGEDTATAVPEPAPAAASSVKKPVSKTNRPIEEYTPYEQGILNDGGWECAFCGTINASYVTSCSCGHSEDDSFLKRRGKYTGPDAEETETSTAETASPEPAQAATLSAAETAAPVPPTPATPSASMTPADMIAEIEQELAADSSEMAKFRAIRKYKNLVKKGYMTKEEFNKKQDELLNFEDDDAMAAPESSGEDNA